MTVNKARDENDLERRVMTPDLRQRLADLLRRSGTSQRAAATAAGVSPSVVSHVLAGDDDTSAHRLQRMVEAAGAQLDFCTPEDLAFLTMWRRLDAEDQSILRAACEVLPQVDLYGRTVVRGVFTGALREIARVSGLGSKVVPATSNRE